MVFFHPSGNFIAGDFDRCQSIRCPGILSAPASNRPHYPRSNFVCHQRRVSLPLLNPSSSTNPVSPAVLSAFQAGRRRGGEGGGGVGAARRWSMPLLTASDNQAPSSPRAAHAELNRQTRDVVSLAIDALVESEHLTESGSFVPSNPCLDGVLQKRRLTLDFASVSSRTNLALNGILLGNSWQDSQASMIHDVHRLASHHQGHHQELSNDETVLS